MPIFGDRLREAREHLKISQQEMANRCGISLRSQRNYEKGDRFPDSEYMAALSGQGIDVSYLLTGSDAKSDAEDMEFMIAQFAGVEIYAKKMMEARGLEVKELPAEYGSRLVSLTKKFVALDEQAKLAVEAMIDALLTKK